MNNIAIIPTLRLKFAKHFSGEAHRQLIHEAESYGGRCKSYTINNLSGGIEETIFVFNSCNELQEFKNTVAKGVGKVKPALGLSYNGENIYHQKRIGKKLGFLAHFFGGRPRPMSYGESRGSIILVFWSNCMCKAYAKCMKWL